MMKKVRYAVIGCGEHALRGHVVPGNEVPALELVGVFDPDDAKMRAVRDARTVQTDFTCYKSETALLEDADVDAIMIASPDRHHMSSLVAAIGEGKHVLCDKPLVVDPLDLHSLDQMLGRAEKRKLVVTSCHPRRFDPPYLWLKKNLDSTKATFGDVQSLELDFSYHKPSKTGLHAGLLADHFNHEFDLTHFLFGHAPAIVHRLHDGDMRYVAVGMRDDGIGFSFHGTRLLEGQHYREFARIRFASGQVDLDCSTGLAVIHDHETGRKREIRPGRTDYAVRFRAVMANFVGAVLGKTPNYLTRQDLRANAESCVRLTLSSHYLYRPL